MAKLPRFHLELVIDGESEKAAPRKLESANAAAAFFGAEIGARDREVIAVAWLDSGFRPLGYEIAHVGTLHSTNLHPREIFKAAMLANAAFITVAHNHPSNDAGASTADGSAAERLRAVGELLQLPLLHFLIVNPSGTWSAVYDVFS